MVFLTFVFSCGEDRTIRIEDVQGDFVLLQGECVF